MQPEWPAPPGVSSYISTVRDGNLAFHAGDITDVTRNREQLRVTANLPAEPFWLEQVHGNNLVVAGTFSATVTRADASYTKEPGRPLVIMVADCLPILLASRSGSEIAVVHAGWRGLACGVIGSALRQFKERDVIAYLGPAIGPCHYEVDGVVRDKFAATTGFGPGRDAHHWMMDLAAIAAHELKRGGVEKVYPCGICTYCDSRFYSHRRDPKSGRFAALLWR